MKNTTPITPALGQAHVSLIPPNALSGRADVCGLRISAQGLDLEVQCSTAPDFCLRHLAQQQQDQSARELLLALATGWPEFLDVCPRFRSLASQSCKCVCACSSPSSSPLPSSSAPAAHMRSDLLSLGISLQNSLGLTDDQVATALQGIKQDLGKRSIYISSFIANAPQS
jgi:hypothetical protein